MKTILIQNLVSGAVSEIPLGQIVPIGYQQVREAERVPGHVPSARGDPNQWRRWWMTLNPDKTWVQSGFAWLSEISK